jgi:hypothetical protein
MYRILTRDCHLNLGEMNKKKYICINMKNARYVI